MEYFCGREEGFRDSFTLGGHLKPWSRPFLLALVMFHFITCLGTGAQLFGQTLVVGIFADVINIYSQLTCEAL